MTHEPKPCPFCGDEQESFAGMTEDAFARGPDRDRSFLVNCGCGAMGPESTSMEGAVELWNRRYISAAKSEPVAWQWRYRISGAIPGEWSEWADGKAPDFAGNTYITEERALYALASEPANG